MKSYYLPREYKGEGRILYIFSKRSLIYTVAGAGIGIFFNEILKMLGINKAFLPLLLIFGILGYLLAVLKIPEGGSMEISKKLGGEKLEDVIKKWILFKMKHSKIYIYKENTIEETKEEEIKNEQ